MAGKFLILFFSHLKLRSEGFQLPTKNETVFKNFSRTLLSTIYITYTLYASYKAIDFRLKPQS